MVQTLTWFKRFFRRIFDTNKKVANDVFDLATGQSTQLKPIDPHSLVQIHRMVVNKKSGVYRMGRTVQGSFNSHGYLNMGPVQLAKPIIYHVWLSYTLNYGSWGDRAYSSWMVLIEDTQSDKQAWNVASLCHLEQDSKGQLHVRYVVKEDTEFNVIELTLISHFIDNPELQEQIRNDAK